MTKFNYDLFKVSNDSFKVSKMIIFNYGLFKVSKMINFNYDLFNSAKCVFSIVSFSNYKKDSQKGYIEITDLGCSEK